MTTKSLYFLHIPKTGGLVLRILWDILDHKDYPRYPSPDNSFTDFSAYKHVHWHFGKLPVDVTNFDTAVLLREPLDRVLSNFAWLAMNAVFRHLPEYEGMTVEQQLKEYLFGDGYYSWHKNLQAKFLNGTISESNMNRFYRKIYPTSEYEIPTEFYTNGLNSLSNQTLLITKNWYFELVEPSFEAAKETLDKCSIVNLTDNHSEFLNQIFNWINENWGLDIKTEFEEKLAQYLIDNNIPYYNYSQFIDEDGATYTSNDFKSLLTPEEIAQVYADNSLDLELYNYAKAKLA